MAKLTLVNSKTVFLATLIVIPVVILLVYVSGLHKHRSIYLNSLISTTILSVFFLVFMATGLYKGWKLKDTLGNFTKKITFSKLPDTSGSYEFIDLPDTDAEGIAGVIVSLIIWLVVALLYSLLFWIAGGLIWATIMLTTGLLYWIIFRAFRLIFKHSPKCRGNLIRSFLVAGIYTGLYNFWIYLIVLGTSFWKK